jgi:YcxB-like protein
MPLQYKYEFTKDDYINYFTYVQQDSPESRNKWRKYYLKNVLYITLFLVSIIILNKGIDFRNNYILILYFSFYIFSYLAQILYAKRNTIKQANAIVNDVSNINMFNEVEIVISESGIELQNEMGYSSYKWKAIIRRGENDQYYFLFISSIQGIIFPKRILKSEEDKKRLEEEFAKYISLEADIRMKQ